MVETLAISTRSEEETLVLGEAFAKRLFPGAFVALYGELGAGKTAFSRGVGKGLSIEDIKSPTFAIVFSSEGRLLLHHFDIYRLSDEKELYDIGYLEYLDGKSAILMEWPQNAPKALPSSRIDIHIEYLDLSERSFSFAPRDDKHRMLIAGLAEAFSGLIKKEE